jgi:hypothetical protein
MVMLSGLEIPKLEMCFPISYRDNPYHCYRFHIPGMTFMATVGGKDSSAVEGRISVLEPPRPILITTLGDRRAQDEMLALMGRIPPRGFEAPLLEGTEKVW